MIAIIPARGGSKGVPGKNIKLLNGKPLIYYTIIEALKSKHVTDVIVSTDSREIASISESYGANCPFLRPDELATDHAKAIDNYIYTVERLNKEFKYNISEFVVLQPTSPLRTYIDIDGAIEQFYEQEADSVISVCELKHSIHSVKRITKDGKLTFFSKSNIKHSNINRQDMPLAYVNNGAVFVLALALLKKNYSYYSDRTYPYIMPQHKSVDIDIQFDFELAEYLMRKENE